MATKKKASKKKASPRSRTPAPVLTGRVVREALAKEPQSNRKLRETLGLSSEKFDPKLDRKLQEMRKNGEIRLVNNRWALATVEKCPACGGKGWVHTAPGSG